MIKVDNISVMNLDNAIKGMRNPLESWNKGDSESSIYTNARHPHSTFDKSKHPVCRYIGLDAELFYLGEQDLALAQKLLRAGGNSHSKFMRQIFISMDITLPLFIWKEFDTYKIGTTTNSCSTMHKLATTPITIENFSTEGFTKLELETIFQEVVYYCEYLRKRYLETKDMAYWRALIELLPCSWMQKRTWSGSYQNLRDMYFDRRHHKLEEWRDFCKVIEELPYGEELITYKPSNKMEEKE